MTSQPRNDASAIIDSLFGNEPGWWDAVAEAHEELERLQLVYDALGTIPELGVADERSPESQLRHEIALLLAVPHPLLGGLAGIEALARGDSSKVAALLTPPLLAARVNRQEALIRSIELAVDQLRRGKTISAEVVHARRAARLARLRQT